MSGIELLLSDNRGVYIPHDFVNSFDLSSWGVNESDDLVTLREGPEAEWYWEAWDNVLNKASFTDSNGNVWRLHQDGDLFAYCEPLMSVEEYENFFGQY